MPGIPGSSVASVRFFIDGKLRHLARTAPYLFAGRGNLLLPGTLGSGSHIFAVDVTLTDGRHLTAAATAVVSVKARGIPRQVLGRWTRTVTAAEVARTQSFRSPADGAPLPAGTWQVRIGADGVARYTGPAHDLTVGQVRFEPGGRLVVGNEIPNFPHASKGGFCRDAAGDGIYHWSHRRPCADRPGRQRPPVRQPQQLLERHLHPISPRRTPSGHSLMPRLRSAQHKEENMNRPSRSVRPLAPLGLLAAAALAAGCSSGHAATAPPSPSPARVTVTSTLDGHTVLPHRIHWQAFASTPAGHISKVNYLIDGRLSWVETLAPYFYGRDGNWLVTSFLKSGEHTFTVRAFTRDGRTATDTVKASVAASAAPPAALAGTWTRVVTPADVKQATTDQPPPAGRWGLQIGPTGWQLHDPSGGGLLFDVGYRPGGSMQMRPASTTRRTRKTTRVAFARTPTRC